MEVAFLIVTTQLLSPVTEINHIALSFIAFAVLMERWNDWRRPSCNILALVLAYAMMNVQVILWSRRVLGITPLLDLGTGAEIIVWILLANQLRIRSRAGMNPNLATAYAPKAG